MRSSYSTLLRRRSRRTRAPRLSQGASAGRVEKLIAGLGGKIVSLADINFETLQQPTPSIAGNSGGPPRARGPSRRHRTPLFKADRCSEQVPVMVAKPVASPGAMADAKGSGALALRRMALSGAANVRRPTAYPPPYCALHSRRRSIPAPARRDLQRRARPDHSARMGRPRAPVCSTDDRTGAETRKRQPPVESPPACSPTSAVGPPRDLPRDPDRVQWSAGAADGEKAFREPQGRQIRS